MAQVKECLENAYECSELINAAPKNCLQKPCRSNCRCKSRPGCQKLKSGFKYVQPCRPEPFKPISQSYKSDAPFADDSVYTCSFFPHVCETRQQPIIHTDHMVMAGEFNDETVHKTSYQIPCTPVVQKIIPKDNCLGGKGPMRLTTTQQHDYYESCAEREKSFVPKGNIDLFDCPMTTLTTTNCSYRPVCADPVENFKPNICYAAPVDDMDLNTVQRSSYKDVGVQEKLDTPWAVKLSYCKPTNAIECCTVYNYSYKEPGEYVIEDSCGNKQNINSDNKLAENCCPFTCLADNLEEQTKSQFIKAHHFDD